MLIKCQATTAYYVVSSAEHVLSAISSEDLQKDRGPKAFTLAETLSLVKARPQTPSA
jgi:hypothetical protein